MSPHGVTAAVPHAMPEHYGDWGSILRGQAVSDKQEEEVGKGKHEAENVSRDIEDKDMNNDDYV